MTDVTAERCAHEQGAVPARPDAASFRDALGHVPTGVTIVTAAGAEGPVGMACNSFTSVSLDPPLVSLCAAHTSLTWPVIRRTGRFCVNVMASGGGRAARRFSRRGIDRFEGVAWHDRPAGPGLDDALAWFDCRIEAEHEAGDHVIVVAAVAAAEARGGVVPLIFFRGGYGSFSPPSPAPRE